MACHCLSSTARQADLQQQLTEQTTTVHAQQKTISALQAEATALKQQLQAKEEELQAALKQGAAQAERLAAAEAAREATAASLAVCTHGVCGFVAGGVCVADWRSDGHDAEGMN